MAGKGSAAPGGSGPVSSGTALDGFSTATRAWFESAFAVPTQAQAQAWRAIGGRDTGGKGADTLVIAPTGSGKTLAAFLWAIDRLAAAPVPAAALDPAEQPASAVTSAKAATALVMTACRCRRTSVPLHVTTDESTRRGLFPVR